VTTSPLRCHDRHTSRSGTDGAYVLPFTRPS